MEKINPLTKFIADILSGHEKTAASDGGFFTEKTPTSTERKPSVRLLLLIDESTITVSLQTEKPDTVVFAHPLATYGPYSGQIAAYERNKEQVRERFLSLLQTECNKLLAAHALTEADETVLCGNEFCLKVLFGAPLSVRIEDYTAFPGSEKLGLPTKTVYVVPPASEFIGGDLFCLSTTKKENSFLVDCQDNISLLYIDKETNTCAYMWEMDYSELSLLTLRAALRVLRPEGTLPLVYLYGKNAPKTESVFAAENLTCILSEKDPNVIASACLPPVRARLINEKRRTSYHDLLRDETFQEALVNLFEENPT